MSGNTIPSEASRMLEAALEQMDGIIQGAKYELPQYFDSFTIQETPPSPHRSSDSLNEALENLKKVIARCPEKVHSEIDKDTQEFLYNWLTNNKSQSSPHSWWKSDSCSPGVHDLTGVEERMLQLERDKDSLQLQVTVLEDQIEGQARKVADLEKQLKTKKEECCKFEEMVGKERSEKSNLELRNGELKTEYANLKLKCARLERDLVEYRNGTPKLQRPTNLGTHLARSPTPVSSPEDNSPTSRKGVVFSDPEENIQEGGGGGVDLDTSMISLSGRSTRGLKKILGKIKRSNSGGFEERLNVTQAASESGFVRGGLRATASGRLGWTARGQDNQKKRFSDWSVDTLCTWLECIGLGQYCGEVQRHIGTGADLARLASADMEAKLGIKQPLHRKKLLLAIQAKVDVNRPDPAGQLDCSWVVRWLDDVGLPQYKETFLESRVDGRLLNLLTVEDLSYLKVNNLLHHLSIKRGIQVLRHNNFNFDFLTRRAVPGEPGGSVETWTNHRVMEWLRQVDLAEYAPNLRGSGVHGGLMVREPRFNAELLASVLSIPNSKTLLRRHLNIHFGDLVGRDVVAEKRKVQSEHGYVPLTPTTKAKYRHGQFTLKRKKSKSEFDVEDSLLCPLSPVLGITKPQAIY